MIEKSKGNYRADELRTIQLYTIDFDIMNKIIGRNMIHKAKKVKLLTKE